MKFKLLFLLLSLLIKLLIPPYSFASDYDIGIETSMRKVFIKNDLKNFGGVFKTQTSISLAKNEYESFQVVVKANKDLSSVQVSANGFSGLQVEAHPVGYVNVTSPTSGFGSEYQGWYPDPILTFVDAVDVQAGDYQAFWITIFAPESQEAGDYTGQLTVSTSNSISKTIHVNITIWDFTLPNKPSFPTAMSWAGERTIEKIYSGTSSWSQRQNNGERFILRKEYDFLIDKYRLFPDRIYGHGLDFLKERFNERGWIDFSNLVPGPIHVNERNGEYYVNNTSKSLDNFMDEYIARLIQELNALPQQMRSSVYTYLLDEEPLELFEVSKQKILSRVRQEVPQAKIVIDSFQDKIVWEFDEGFADLFDVLIFWEFWPSGDSGGGIKQFQEAKDFLHQRGKKIWWYITDTSPNPINWHLESELISTRLLLGMINAKFRPDGFLYWEIGAWTANGANNNDEPLHLANGSYCNWDTRTVGLRANGDGALILPGPDMIIPTIRLANFRDGMEDYEYYVLLEQLKNRTGDANLASQAENLLKVSNDVVGSYPLDHTYRADILYQERSKVAALIIQMGGGQLIERDNTPPNVPTGISIQK